MNKVSPHGGADRGQGRHYLNRTRGGVEQKAIRITITLTAEDLAYLDQISPRFQQGVRADEPNRSEGVRRALSARRREEKALLAETQHLSAEVKADPSLMVTDEELARQLAAKVALPVAD